MFDRGDACGVVTESGFSNQAPEYDANSVSEVLEGVAGQIDDGPGHRVTVFNVTPQGAPADGLP